MHYKQDEFFRLMEEIERQGGEHLDETHDPVYHKKMTGTATKGQEVVYCGEVAQFTVPYEPIGHPESVLATVKVCAVDDRMGLWPRFAKANAPGQEG